MKKIFLLCAAALFVASLPVAAQQQSSGLPDMFVKTVLIQKVFMHELGYKILFINSKQQPGWLYVPIKWFGQAAGKGATVFEADGTPPYFSIFWANGKFDHIVLHVDANPNSPTWGILSTTEDLKDVFNIEEPKLDF